MSQRARSGLWSVVAVCLALSNPAGGYLAAGAAAVGALATLALALG
jgi:hypothetical protein